MGLIHALRSITYLLPFHEGYEERCRPSMLETLKKESFALVHTPSSVVFGSRKNARFTAARA